MPYYVADEAADIVSRIKDNLKVKAIGYILYFVLYINQKYFSISDESVG